MNYLRVYDYAKPASKHSGLKFIDLYFLAYLCYAIFGYTGQNHNYILFGLFLLLVAFAFFAHPDNMIKAVSKKKNLIFIFFLLYYFISSMLVGEISYTLTYVGMFLIHYGSMWYYEYYHESKSREKLVKITFCALIIWLTVCVIAIVFYIQNPQAARTLASDFYHYGTIAIGGGYALAFGSAIISVCIFEALITGRIEKRSERVFALISILILAFLVWKVESTITTLAMLTGMLVSTVKRLFFYRKSGEEGTENGFSLKIIISIFVLLLAAVAVFANFNNIGRYVVEQTDDKCDVLFFKRINRIGLKMQYYGTDAYYENYVDERLATVSLSSDTFIKNPLFGVGYKYGNYYSSAYYYGVGCHSEFMDALAAHGIIGGVPLILIYIFAFIDERKRKYAVSYSYIITALFLVLFNPFQSFQGCFALFFMAPAINCCLNYRKEKLQVGQHPAVPDNAVAGEIRQK